jgi:hypothetical protein
MHWKAFPDDSSVHTVVSPVGGSASRVSKKHEFPIRIVVRDAIAPILLSELIISE